MLFASVSFLYLAIMGIVCGLIMQIPPIKNMVNNYLDHFEDFED